MGKITGFMEYERIEEGYKPVAERLKNYKEFVIGLDDTQASVQAKRILAAWNEYRPKFVKVFPNEYRRALGELAAKHKRRAA